MSVREPADDREAYLTLRHPRRAEAAATAAGNVNKQAAREGALGELGPNTHTHTAQSRSSKTLSYSYDTCAHLVTPATVFSFCTCSVFMIDAELMLLLLLLLRQRASLLELFCGLAAACF